MKSNSLSYYPVFLDIRRKKCVVVGGGRVALRKVMALLDAGADVKVISPDLCPGLSRLVETKRVAVAKRPFQPGDLEGALITVAATDNDRINLEVAEEAHEKGILVNVVDNPFESDFIVPSCLRRGDVTVAVSTAGRSPALARKIRLTLEKELDDEYGALALMIDDVRQEIRSQGVKLNGNDWQRALDLDLLIGLLKKNDKEQARSVLLGNLKSLKR
jgi:siroheme synthase-like protein